MGVVYRKILQSNYFRFAISYNNTKTVGKRTNRLYYCYRNNNYCFLHQTFEIIYILTHVYLIPESLKEDMSLLVYKRRLRSDKSELNNEA